MSHGGKTKQEFLVSVSPSNYECCTSIAANQKLLLGETEECFTL
jgi:hypothetical protein